MRRPALRDRHQDVGQQRVCLRRLVVVPGLGRACFVDELRAVQIERETALRVVLLRKQHVADVRVFHQPDLRARRVLAARSRGMSLRTVALMQTGGVTRRRRTEPYPDARLVHHVEHAGEPLAGFAHQIPDRARLAVRPILHTLAEIQQATGDATIAHLPRENHDGHSHRLLAVAPVPHPKKRGASPHSHL